MQRRLFAMVAWALTALVLLASAPAVAGAAEVIGIDPADMDRSVSPRVDFYRYANGGWLDRTTIPPDRSSYGSFTELRDRTTRQLIALLEARSGADAPAEGSDEWKAVRLYEQGMDVERRNRLGVAPIAPIVAEVDAIADLAGFHRFLWTSRFSGVTGIVPLDVEPDAKESDVNAVYLGGPWLGLPNRDYYLEENPENAAIRAAYVETGGKLLEFLGYDADRARQAAQAVYDLERRLAEPTLTREQRQDPNLSYNPVAVADLPRRYPLMDWRAYLDALAIGRTETVIVSDLGYLDALPGIVESVPLDVLKDYLKLQLLWEMGASLSEEIAATRFRFTGRALGGLEAMPPLDERVVGRVDDALPDALGKLYVAEHFPPEAKAQIEALVADLVAAFRARLERNDWMSAGTKAEALAKLAALGVKVGYPDEWETYEEVEIGASFAETLLNAGAAALREKYAEAGQPVDRTKWETSAQTVNAYYDPVKNEIVFPAGILQPPFFDYRTDAATNLGGIGFVIGHEITHGFDLTGSQYDAEGNLRDWWTAGDRERFEALNKRLADQYDAIEVLPGQFINGRLTVGENAADLGGVQVAFEALQTALARDPGAATPVAADAGLDLTPEQRFFVSAATIWRIEYRQEALLTLIKSDPHSPGMVRGVQPARNTAAFYGAFGIEPGNPMFLPPAERIVIW